jgi:3'-5' exoribonuclease
MEKEEPMEKKELFISSIATDQGVFTEPFQVVSSGRKATAQGKPYLDLKLRDKTGDVAAKVWDVAPDFPELTIGCFIKVRCEAGEYPAGKLQLKVMRAKLLEAAEIDLADYLPASKNDREEMFCGLGSYIGQVHNRALRDALWTCCTDLKPMLLNAPAAKSVHQAYLGGLLDHIIALCKLADVVCSCYPELSRDILLAGCILHDIGKVVELRYDTQIGYTRAGTLTGHIIQGSILWAKYSGDVDVATREHVQHIIASHHGIKEWGAAVLPMTREAQIFHLLDMIDSRYEIATNALAGGVDENGMTEWNKTLGMQIWNGK